MGDKFQSSDRTKLFLVAETSDGKEIKVQFKGRWNTDVTADLTELHGEDATEVVKKAVVEHITREFPQVFSSLWEKVHQALKSPKTLEEAVDLIVGHLSDEDKEDIRSKGLLEFTATAHMGGGMKMRNDWNLWDKTSDLHQWFFTEHGIWHADDMSGCILHAVYCEVNDTPYLIEDDKRRFEEHWRESYGFSGPPPEYLNS